MNNVLSIPDNTKYWLVRANSKAVFFNDFKYNNFIAIGDNYVKLSDLNRIPSVLRTTSDLLKNQYKEIFFNRNIKFHEEFSNNNLEENELKKIKRSSSIAASKAYKFIEKMQIGDVVIVPNERSSYFLLGIIISGPFDDDIHHVKLESTLDISDDVGYQISSFEKKRRVFWIKEFSHNELPRKLSWIFKTRQTIYELTHFANEINPLLSLTYFYKDNFYTRINVTSKKPLSTDDFFNLQKTIRELSLQKSKSDIFQKIDIQSPGFISLNTILENWQVIMVIIGSLFGNVDIDVAGFKMHVKGIIPYFLGREHQKTMELLEENIKEEEVRSKRDDNTLKELQIKKEQLQLKKELKATLDFKKEYRQDKAIAKLDLTNSEAGNVIPIENQMDNLMSSRDKLSQKK